MSFGRLRLMLLAAPLLVGCGAYSQDGAAPQVPVAPVFGAQVLPAAPTLPGLATPAASAPVAVRADADPPFDDSGVIDDDDEALGLASPPAAANSPLLALSDAELERRYQHDRASLGSASVGAASAGVLVNGVPMPESPLWALTDPGRAYGTQETVDALRHCIERVNQRFPGTPRISIGHLSSKNGGHLSPHRSHQSGRDADVGYYYLAGTKPFVHATAENLDLPRTWALIKSAVRETTVEMILVDHAVQKILADYAVSAGEDPAFVDQVFQVRGKNARAVVRHVHGHDNHIHFRFHNPVAEAVGRRIARFVVVPKPLRAPPAAPVAPGAPVNPRADAPAFAQIRAHSGDTLVILARRYGTTVEDIQRANAMSGNAIRAGVTYRIPVKGPVPVAAKPPLRRWAKGPQRVAARKSSKAVLHTPPKKP